MIIKFAIKILVLVQNKKYRILNQYLIGLLLILVIAIPSYLFVDTIGYRVVALILLLAVSVLAMLFDILPVLTTAILSALVWNFFFIPPTITFSIGDPEDTLLFLMYFVVALINAVLTFKIRGFEKKSRDREERENTIKLYNTLLNSLSHELRTPIATIIGAVDTIKENEFKLSERNRRELFDEIEIASFRLNRQVENLLNMSRLEAGALKPKPDWCDINELIYSVIKSNKDAASHHQIVFESGEMPLIKIDRGILEQVIQNVIHNALQYTPQQSIIDIRVSKNNGNCILIISDTGPGVPDEEIDAVFDKFYRLPASITGGTGLGLSIAKGFMESLKGSIRLENRKEGGAKFILTIPVEV